MHINPAHLPDRFELSIFFLAPSAFASYVPVANLNQFGSSAFSGYGLVANGNPANHNFHLSSDTAVTGNVGFDNTTNGQSISLNNGTITGNYNTSGTNTALGGGVRLPERLRAV